MAKYIPSGGSVISGKYEKGLIYVDEEYKEISVVLCILSTRYLESFL